ncbi:MAG: hypothetical protein K9N38_05070 [Candidatus Marinimicrobia bacterium]|nr:hypothetical protein [Candidatus Neomarinimicrobiota bacterium]MCF7851029.1 hypothetical protein [Candidatus Neomarinimicrobiota bacterium]
MLIAVIAIFLVMSFTGVAVLDISYTSSTSAQGTVSNIKSQYILESSINESLWLINAGADSVVTRIEGGVTTTWDSLSQVLTVHVDTFGSESEVSLHLDDDSHFERGIASRSGLNTNGNAYGLNRQKRNFNFLPGVDMTYFNENALQIENGNENSFKNSDIADGGIVIFTGNNLSLDSLNLSAATLVFTGKNITITNSSITANAGTEFSNASPAIVFTNSWESLTIEASNTINGAIFSAGELNLYGASMTGPIIGETVNLMEDITLNDEFADNYYTWTNGFGDQLSYDWPKEIDTWMTTLWERSTNG